MSVCVCKSEYVCKHTRTTTLGEGGGGVHDVSKHLLVSKAPETKKPICAHLFILIREK